MRIKVKNFDLKSVITSGACFRFIEEQDGSFTNILKDRVINIKQNNDEQKTDNRWNDGSSLADGCSCDGTETNRA